MLYFVRREPNALIELPFAWLISITSTLLPFLYRPIQEALFEQLLSAGYFIRIIGMAVMMGSLLSFALQYSRSRIEENFLMDDPGYKLYMSCIRYRFIPGLL